MEIAVRKNMAFNLARPTRKSVRKGGRDCGIDGKTSVLPPGPVQHR
jgi:hypothetical protein